MGKPNKTTAWFQAVKKAFRSPSKEKSDNKDSDTVKVTTDAHVMLDNSAQEKEHKWELSPPLAAAARDVESIITTGSNHAKQSASELLSPDLPGVSSLKEDDEEEEEEEEEEE
ncbi:unnamed protein product, partial [Sphagnum jensenii]